jgi:soluble lytic murein transglycosylase-like protein
MGITLNARTLSFATIFILALNGSAFAHKSGRASTETGGRAASSLAQLVSTKAAAHGVPTALAHAVVRVESNYRPHLTGRVGEVGLMQIKYQTARGLGYRGTRKALYEPATNLEWGMRYLAGARRLAGGDVCRTVLKYQGGHGATRVSRMSSAYCSKVKTFLASRTRSAAADPAPDRPLTP